MKKQTLESLKESIKNMEITAEDLDNIEEIITPGQAGSGIGCDC